MREPDAATNRLSKEVVDAAVEVHRVLGPGFLESAYEGALAAELSLRGIDFERQASVPIAYKGVAIGDGRVDLLVAKRLIVELKTVESLLPIHSAQVISYLKATGLELGLLINFNVPVLRQGIKRVVLTR